MLVLYFLVLWALFLGLGVFGSVFNGNRDFDRGLVIFGAPSALMGALVTSVATGSDFPVLVAAFIVVIAGSACVWGHYSNPYYTPPAWEDIKEVEKDPLEDFRVALALAVAGQAKAEARIRELENDKRALLSAAQHQQRAISDLIDRVEALEARAETPKPVDLLEANQQVMREVVRVMTCFDAQDPRVRAPSAHASA
jgi:hypothetical protein